MKVERYPGIDYLRALFSVCVVTVHLGYVSPSWIFSKELYQDHVPTFSDFVNFYVLLLAVPVFFLISNYLFIAKARDTSVLKASLTRIASIAIFWIAVHTIIGYSRVEFLNVVPHTMRNVMTYILSGGHTVFYFFISLFGLTIVAHYIKYLSLHIVLVSFLAATALVALIPPVSVMTQHFYLSVYWNPVNFLPYPFAARLVHHFANIQGFVFKPLHVIFLVVVEAILVAVDWTLYVDKGFFIVNAYAIPTYARPSLILLSMVVLYAAIKIKPRVGGLIQFMSRNSLGLYCVHPLFLDLARSEDVSHGSALLSLAVVLALSYPSVVAVRKFVNKELINWKLAIKSAISSCLDSVQLPLSYLHMPREARIHRIAICLIPR